MCPDKNRLCSRKNGYSLRTNCILRYSQTERGGGGGGGRLIIHEMENENPLKMHTAVNNFIDSPPFGQYIFNLFNLIAINHQ